MNVTVIGDGRWGSFLAWYADRVGHSVTLVGKAGSAHTADMIKNRKNEYLSFSDGVCITDSYASAESADVIIVSVPSQALDGLCRTLAGLGINGGNFVLCMKGIEVATGRRLSQIARDALGERARIAVWIGPGHVQEFLRGIPNCMVIDSLDEELKHFLVDSFSSDLIRFYYGTDLIGNEVGAAAKNVIGIAAGMLDGLGVSTLKGALMSRGTREISRLIVAMGGRAESAYGLCHLGDYEATVFSEFSHNRAFGEGFVQGKEYDKLAEGYYTAAAIVALGQRLGVELPICEAVYNVLYESCDPKIALDALFIRPLKKEF